jgi:hypothetical protein
LVAKLSPDERQQLAFGVPDEAGHPRLLSTFARLADVGKGAVPLQLADLAVAQAFDLQGVTAR